MLILLGSVWLNKKLVKRLLGEQCCHATKKSKLGLHTIQIIFFIIFWYFFVEIRVYLCIFFKKKGFLSYVRSDSCKKIIEQKWQFYQKLHNPIQTNIFFFVPATPHFPNDDTPFMGQIEHIGAHCAELYHICWSFDRIHLSISTINKYSINILQNVLYIYQSHL